VANVSGQPVTVLGAGGTLDERAAAFRTCIREGRQVVSMSASGCLGRWLATHDPAATSLSIITYIPERPVYAAMVTANTALLSDCSGSWRLTLTDGRQAMTGEPLVAEPAPGYIVLPRTPRPRPAQALRRTDLPQRHQLRHRPGRPRRRRPRRRPLHRTRPGLRALPRRRRPRHDRPRRQRGTHRKALGRSRRLYKALTGDITFGDEPVIARDMWAIRRATRVLAHARHPEEQPHPLDDPLDAFDLEDDDIFGFRPGSPAEDDD